MNARKSGILFSLLTLLAPCMAQAQDPFGLGYGLLFGYGAANTPLIRSFVPAPPYFALHPPVYYGKKYTRPYGESPFASWPQLRSPVGYEPRPAANYVAPVVINLPSAHGPVDAAPMFLDPQAAPPAPAAPAAPVNAAPSPVVLRSVTQPLVIDNPYYLDAGSKDAAQLVAAPK